MSDLAFPFSLSNSQRKQIHSISEKLGLRYQSYGENENRYIIVSKKKDEESRNSPSTQIPKRKQSASSSSVAGSWSDRSGASGPSSRYGSSWNDKSANLLGKTPPERDVGRTRSMGGKDKWPSGASPSSSYSSSSSFVAFLPKREPKGPDGTNGFSAEYRASRLR